MSDSQTTPATVPSTDLVALMGATQSPALQIMLNDALFKRCKEVAAIMAGAEGVTPAHLLRKPDACFSVVSMSIIWKLAPMMVAGSTFQIPGSGKIGYEGKLVQAILENSGQFEGQIKPEYFGEWDRILGKFTIETNQQQKKYAKQAWVSKDEDGLGVIVRGQVRGELEPREFRFLLKQAFPRNSTIWATDPMTQLWYTAIRRFGSVAAPGIMMGVPFDRDEMSYVEDMRDITPTTEPSAPRARPAKPSKTQRQEDLQRTQHVAETVIEETPKETTDAKKEPEGQKTEPEAAGEQGEADGGAQAPSDQAPDNAVDGDLAKRSGDDPGNAGDDSGQHDSQVRPTVSESHDNERAASDGGKSPGLTPLTPDEVKKLRTDFEKAVLNAKDMLAIDALTTRHGKDMKRLKVTDVAIYDRLISMYSGRKKHLEEVEARES